MEDSGSPIVSRIVRLLPVLMIGMLVMGIILFAATTILPRWRAYEAINQQIEAAKQTLAEQSAASGDDTLAILERQIESAQQALTDAAATFMSTAQADQILDQFYVYAAQSGVQISSLQAQLTSAPAASDAQAQANPAVGIYRTQAFRLQVDGTVPRLMAFVSRIREAALPALLIQNLALQAGLDRDTLTMDALIYSSPIASGEAYLNLPAVQLPAALTFDPVVIQQETALLEAVGTVQPPVLPELPPDPPLTLLLTDSFDSGDLTNWNLGAGWFLANDTSGQVLTVADSSSETTLTYNTLQDVAVRARVWLETGGVRLNLRQSAAGRYTATLDALGVVALYRGERLIQSAVIGITGVGRWRVLRMSAVQGVVRLSVDDVEVLRFEDSGALPPGTVSWSMLGQGSIRLDDIEVWVREST